VTKVLYVEHNDDNLYMLKTRLELRGGFEVLAAEDSEKGCRLAAPEHPDVILASSSRLPGLHARLIHRSYAGVPTKIGRALVGEPDRSGG
jgi:DNA-binding response OmpR family regulator